MPHERVLVVDDTPANLKLVRILLSREGYVIQTARDAEEALLMLESFAPRVVVTDVELPGMSGVELVQMIKRYPVYRRIVTIALTAHAARGDRERLLSAGCDGFLAKPFDADTLTNTVAAHIRGADDVIV